MFFLHTDAHMSNTVDSGSGSLTDSNKWTPQQNTQHFGQCKHTHIVLRKLMALSGRRTSPVVLGFAIPTPYAFDCMLSFFPES